MAEKEEVRTLIVGEDMVVYGAGMKGFDPLYMVRYDTEVSYLKEALEKNNIKVTHLPCLRACDEFPYSIEKLKQFDVLVLSDVGSNTLLLPSDVFLRSLSRPNRLELIKSFVSDGGGLIMVGGYMSFQGIYGRARYQGTQIEEILPVSIKEVDDRVELPEGCHPRTVNRDHPVMKGIPDEWPMLLGYNKTFLKDGAELLVEFRGDPIAAAWEYEKGRTMAFTSDCAPHWGTREFLNWTYYPTFWIQAVRWLTHRI